MSASDLLLWLKQAPVTRRIEAAAPIARTYLHAELNDEQAAVLDAAMTLLADDAEPEVRLALSEALAHSERAPRHLVLALMRDAPEIAAPILRHSPLLIDSELVDAVATSGVLLQAAVAGRPYVSRGVSAALGEVGALEAVQTLLENGEAVITETTFGRIVERFGDSGAVRQALFRRADLPARSRHTLLAALARQLPQTLRRDSWVGPERATVVAREAGDRATVLLAASLSVEDLPDLVRHLREQGELTTLLLIRALAGGNIAFFEAALAELAGLPVARVFTVLASGSRSACSALMRKAGLPARAHGVFLLALDCWRDGEGHAGDAPAEVWRMTEALIGRYQAEPDAADDVLAVLRQVSAEAARDAARSFTAVALAA